MATELAKAAKRLMDAVNFDMIGENGRGGNGGLISRETMRASDELRRVLVREANEDKARKLAEYLNGGEFYNPSYYTEEQRNLWRKHAKELDL